MPRLDLGGRPNTKQELFLRSKKQHIAYGGARGGGKSWAVRTKAKLLALSKAGIKILILRRTLAELRENHLNPLLLELKDVATYKDKDNRFTFPNGSSIKLGYCDAERDVLQYQGQEYEVIFLEEATHFTEYQRNFLATCLRTTRSDITPRMYYTANPGGVGHDWFKRAFVSKSDPRFTPDNSEFIQANVYDNKMLMERNPEYVSQLEGLPERERKAHLLGDWDAYDGGFFTVLDKDDKGHYLTQEDKDYLQSYEHKRQYAAIDYGLDAYAPVYATVLYEGITVVTNAFKVKDHTPSQATILAKEYETTHHLAPEVRIAPPDLWQRSKESAIHIASLFADSGHTLHKGDNTRVAGWFAVKELIQRRCEDHSSHFFGRPLLLFDNTDEGVKTLLSDMMSAQTSKRNPDDMASEPHEITHLLDALRYLCIMRRQGKYVVPPPKTGFYTKTMIEDGLNQPDDSLSQRNRWRSQRFGIVQSKRVRPV